MTDRHTQMMQAVRSIAPKQEPVVRQIAAETAGEPALPPMPRDRVTMRRWTGETFQEAIKESHEKRASWQTLIRDFGGQGGGPAKKVEEASPNTAARRAIDLLKEISGAKDHRRSQIPTVSISPEARADRDAATEAVRRRLREAGVEPWADTRKGAGRSKDKAKPKSAKAGFLGLWRSGK